MSHPLPKYVTNPPPVPEHIKELRKKLAAMTPEQRAIHDGLTEAIGKDLKKDGSRYKFNS